VPHAMVNVLAYLDIFKAEFFQERHPQAVQCC